MSCAAAPNALTDQQLAQLARLAEIGMDIAEAAGRQARGEGEGADGCDPALSFARASRAVRLTIALHARLVAERGTAQATEARRRRNRIHARVEQAVERVAETEHAGADAVENLSAAAWERLTETDDAELLDRPIEEVVALICTELGMSAGWVASVFGAAREGGEGGPLGHPSGDSSPVHAGAGKVPAPVRLPCPAEDGGAAPQGRRGQAVHESAPPPG